MKTRFGFLKTFALTLPLALWGLSGAPALGDAQSKTLPAASTGRDSIMEKLQSIRLTETPKAWESLPLVELVRGLIDETKMRDPARVGINFLFSTAPPLSSSPAIDPNTGLPITQPAAPFDVGAVNVHLAPPLRDVRLADVLDAITKTADAPITYSVEDYGVVFMAKGSEPTPKPKVSFSFSGGTPRDFIQAVEKQFRVDWLSIASIPREMDQVQVPKLRFTPKPEPVAEAGKNSPLSQLVLLYNSLAEHSPQLGTLLVTGEPYRPSAVMLVPNKAATVLQAQMKTKVFPLRGIPEKDWPALEEEIARTGREARELEGPMTRREAALPGFVNVHRGSALLVVMGAPSYVEMAESIVTAFQANSAEAKAAPEKK